MFLVYHVISQNHVIAWPFDFMGDHRYCGRGGIIILVCHVISQDHVTKGWSNMGGKPSWQVTSLLSMVLIDTVIVETMILVCHVISQDHVIEGS